MCEARWEHFPHEGDLGGRGFGNIKAEAFEQAALALTAVVTDLKHVEAKEVVVRRLMTNCFLSIG